MGQTCTCQRAERDVELVSSDIECIITKVITSLQPALQALEERIMSQVVSKINTMSLPGSNSTSVPLVVV
jgi:hypothetical protein